MHKIHWAPVLVAAAAGLALTAIPSNAEASEALHSGANTISSSLGGGELIHGLIVLTIVAIAVSASHISKRKT